MSLDIEAWIRYPKIDVHCHSDGGDALGVREIWLSRLIGGGRIAPMEDVRRRNDDVLAMMEQHPTRIRGLCFVIPGYYKEAVAEVERCLDAGMIGIKLYNQYRINDPAVWPIIELAIERRVPILEHAGYLSAPEHLEKQPLISHGVHFSDVSQKYPEAMLIHAHISGGGDWERTLRAMRDASHNVYIDTGGSNLDDGQIEFAVAELGAERVLFGSDGTIAGSVGKVVDATITKEEKELIFWGNAERILAAQRKKPLTSKNDNGMAS